MTRTEELLRKAELHDQAAKLLRIEADRHEAEAEELRAQTEKESADHDG